MKKSLRKLFLGLFVMAPLCLTNCNISNPKISQNSDYDDVNEIRKIYNLYLESGGDMSYEMWLLTIKGDKGDQGNPGKDGCSILSGHGAPSFELGKIGDSYIDLDSWNYYLKAEDSWILQGNLKGDRGVSIVSITKTSSNENVDTYTILYSDGTTSTFTVTNGESIKGDPGIDGKTPVITIGENGNWFVDGVDTGIGAQGPKGEKGDQGNPGNSPYIGENGNWWIGDVDTGIKAQGEKGDQGNPGSNGYSILTGEGEPTNDLGKDGDTYIDTNSWDFFVKVDGTWILKGNIKGEPGQGIDLNEQGLEFFLLDDGTYGVGAGSSIYLSCVEIPSTYNGRQVTTLVDYFGSTSTYCLGKTKKIILPKSINHVGRYSIGYQSPSPNDPFTIEYKGTYNEFGNIQFDDNWLYKHVESTTLICTDKNINLRDAFDTISILSNEPFVQEVASISSYTFRLISSVVGKISTYDFDITVSIDDESIVKATSISGSTVKLEGLKLGETTLKVSYQNIEKTIVIQIVNPKEPKTTITSVSLVARSYSAYVCVDGITFGYAENGFKWCWGLKDLNTTAYYVGRQTPYNSDFKDYTYDVSSNSFHVELCLSTIENLPTNGLIEIYGGTSSKDYGILQIKSTQEAVVDNDRMFFPRFDISSGAIQIDQYSPINLTHASIETNPQGREGIYAKIGGYNNANLTQEYLNTLEPYINFQSTLKWTNKRIINTEESPDEFFYRIDGRDIFIYIHIDFMLENEPNRYNTHLNFFEDSQRDLKMDVDINTTYEFAQAGKSITVFSDTNNISGSGTFWGNLGFIVELLD